jgi:hypothetical protein
MRFSRLMAWVAREMSNSASAVSLNYRATGPKKCAVVPSTICVSPAILSDHAYRGEKAQSPRHRAGVESSDEIAQGLQGRPLEWGWYGSGVYGLENGRE